MHCAPTLLVTGDTLLLFIWLIVFVCYRFVQLVKKEPARMAFALQYFERAIDAAEHVSVVKCDHCGALTTHTKDSLCTVRESPDYNPIWAGWTPDDPEFPADHPAIDKWQPKSFLIPKTKERDEALAKRMREFGESFADGPLDMVTDNRDANLIHLSIPRTFANLKLASGSSVAAGPASLRITIGDRGGSPPRDYTPYTTVVRCPFGSIFGDTQILTVDMGAAAIEFAKTATEVWFTNPNNFPNPRTISTITLILTCGGKPYILIGSPARGQSDYKATFEPPKLTLPSDRLKSSGPADRSTKPKRRRLETGEQSQDDDDDDERKEETSVKKTEGRKRVR